MREDHLEKPASFDTRVNTVIDGFPEVKEALESDPEDDKALKDLGSLSDFAEAYIKTILETMPPDEIKARGEQIDELQAILIFRDEVLQAKIRKDAGIAE